MFWKKVRIVTSFEAREALHHRLISLGIDSSQEEVRDDGALVLTIYLPWIAESDRKIKDIKKALRRLRALDIAVGRGAVNVLLYDDGEEEEWSVLDPSFSMPPFRVGERFVIAGVEENYGYSPQDLVILMAPGRAWGTGSHPTTMFCIRALERYLKRGQSAVDLGCGTGVLAIASARLGASRVLAVDMEMAALLHTSLNIEANSLEKSISLIQSDSLECLKSKSNIIVANLLGDILEKNASSLFSHLLPEGILICSGFEKESIQTILQCFETVGFSRLEEISDMKWAALVLAKKAEA
ncbi:MAG: 50S ribosomal protein L11 methyltransferase [Vulcanimicrobiota bacterium]